MERMGIKEKCESEHPLRRGTQVYLGHAKEKERLLPAFDSLQHQGALVQRKLTWMGYVCLFSKEQGRVKGRE